jgi:hypothetical protein
MELWALDQFTPIARLVGYTSVEIVERDLGTGAWSVELPLDEASGAALRMLGATWPGLEVRDPTTGWRFGGFLTAATIVQTDDGDDVVRFSGSDFQSDLANRLEYPVADDEGLWWANVVGGTLPLTTDATNTMEANCGTAAPVGRRMVGLTIAPDDGLGSAKTRRLRGDTLMDVMQFLFGGTDYTCRLRFHRSGNGDAGVEFSAFERPVAATVLEARTGTFGQVEQTQRAATATSVVAMGALTGSIPEPEERLVRSAVANEFDWRFRHREVFINRPSTDSSPALTDEALALLVEPVVSVKVDGARVEGFGATIDIGWWVDVRTRVAGVSTTPRLPVVGSTRTYSPGAGWERTVDVGTEVPDGPAGMLAQVARVARRVRQVENELRT